MRTLDLRPTWRGVASSLGVGIAIVLLVAVTVALLGCGDTLGNCVRAVNASQLVLRATPDALEAVHDGARDRAIAAAVTPEAAKDAAEAVHEKFAPAWTAYDGALIVWRTAHVLTRDALTAEKKHGEDAVKTEDARRAVAKLVAMLLALERTLAERGVAVTPLAEAERMVSSEVLQ